MATIPLCFEFFRRRAMSCRVNSHVVRSVLQYSAVILSRSNRKRSRVQYLHVQTSFYFFEYIDAQIYAPIASCFLWLLQTMLSLKKVKTVWMQRSRQRVNIKKEKIWRGRGRGKGKRRWWRPGDMPLMPPIRPPANELVIEMWSRQVLITDVSVSLLCRFCKKMFEFKMKY